MKRSGLYFQCELKEVLKSVGKRCGKKCGKEHVGAGPAEPL